MPGAKKLVWIEASPTSVESTNQVLPQVNRLRDNIFGLLPVQGNGSHYCNVVGRSHDLWEGYGEHRGSHGKVSRYRDPI